MPRRIPVTMAESWAEYSKSIFQDFVPSKVQLTETRRAFYAGMITLQSIMNGLPDDESAGFRILQRLYEEQVEFTLEIAAEVARQGVQK